MQAYDTLSRQDPITFKYPDNDAAVFVELRALANIQVDPQASNINTANTIISYAHSLFTHNGENQPSSFDPITIIKEAQAGQSFRCVEYSQLAAALLWAYGIPARTLGLKTYDVETREFGAGHVVIEFWNGTHWAMCDVQAGIVPTANEEPLSAFAFGERIRQGSNINYLGLKNSRFLSSFGSIDEYVKWVAEYLYFYDTPIKLNFEPITDRSKELIVMLVPLHVKKPKLFQGLFEMNAIYTSSVKDFYAAPIR